MNRRISGIVCVVVALCLAIISFAACDCCSSQPVSRAQRDAADEISLKAQESSDLIRANDFIASKKAIVESDKSSFTKLLDLYNDAEMLTNCVISRHALLGDGWDKVNDFQKSIVKKMMTSASTVDQCSAVGKGITNTGIYNDKAIADFYQKYISLCKTPGDYKAFLTTTRIGGDDLPKFRTIAFNKLLESPLSLDEMVWLTIIAKTVGQEPAQSENFAIALKKLDEYKASPDDFDVAYRHYKVAYPEEWDYSSVYENYFLTTHAKDNTTLDSFMVQDKSVSVVLTNRK